jgi:hypothetical protein
MGDDDGLVETTQLLRQVLAERAARLTEPVGVYETIGHRRRSARLVGIVAVAATVAALAGALPVGLAAVRRSAVEAGPSTAATAGSCTAQPAPGRPVALPAPRGVRGSLAGDQELVRTALASGWQEILAATGRLVPSPRTAPDPRTARLVLVERAGAGVIGLVTATDASRRVGYVQWIGRPGATAPLVGLTGQYNKGIDPYLPGAIRPAYFAADLGLAENVTGCRQQLLVVVAPAGTTAARSETMWSRVRTDGGVEYSTPQIPVPLQDGIAVVPVADHGVLVTISRGDQALWSWPLPGRQPVALTPTGSELDSAIQAAPASADPRLARQALENRARWLSNGTSERLTDPRVLWGGTSPQGRALALISLRFPSGARYIAGLSRTPDGTNVALDYDGLLPAGIEDRTALAWSLAELGGPPAGRSGSLAGLGGLPAGRSGSLAGLGGPPAGPDRPLVVAAPGAASAEAVRADGALQPITLHDGGAILPHNTGIRLIRVFDATHRLIGHTRPDAALSGFPS